jgi:hypothetical protein
MWTYDGAAKFVGQYFAGLVVLGFLYLVGLWAGAFS